MKLISLIAFLKTLPQDLDVFVAGTDRFYIHYLNTKGLNPYITFDTDQISHEDFEVTKKQLTVFDSLKLSTQFESELLRQERIDDSLKQSKAILKALEKKEGK
jgi:hypothetical protein